MEQQFSSVCQPKGSWVEPQCQPSVRIKASAENDLIVNLKNGIDVEHSKLVINIMSWSSSACQQVSTMFWWAVISINYDCISSVKQTGSQTVEHILGEGKRCWVGLLKSIGVYLALDACGSVQATHVLL